MNGVSNPLKGWIQGIVASVCSGFFVIPFKLLGQNVDAMVGVYMLFVCALGMSFLSFVFQPKKNLKLERLAWVIVLCAFVTILGNQFAILALGDLAPAIMQTIQRSEIIALVLFGWLFFGEPLKLIAWFSLGLVFLGVFFINYHEADFQTVSLMGSLFALLSGVFFALFQTLNKFLIAKYTPVEINFYRLVIALLALAFFPGNLAGISETTPESWLWAFLAAFLGPFFGRLMYTYTLKHLEIGKLGFCQASGPVFAILAQFAIFGTFINFNELIGSLLIIGAVLLVFWDSGRTKKTG